MNLEALKAAIKLIADAVNDSMKNGKDIAGYANLLPDVMALMPQIGQISPEAMALQPADYAILVSDLAADLSMPDAHVAGIVNASVKLLSDLATVMLPDIKALMAAIAVAPVAPAP